MSRSWLRPVLAAFLVCYGVALAAILARQSGWYWMESALLLAGTAATLVALARRLPAQNVAVIAAIIGLASAFITILSAKTSIPFGPRAYTERFGARLFGILPWPVPLLWLCVLLNSRAVARLILRPWRKAERYGLWLIAITALLAVATDFGLEPYATQVRHYWIWQTPGALLFWQTAPLVNFWGWAATAVVLLVFAAPWLINKRPVKQSPDFIPLALWLLLNLYFVAANAMNGFVNVAVAGVTLTLAAGMFAARGATW